MILSGLPVGPDKRLTFCVHPPRSEVVATCPHHHLFATFLACR